MYSGSDIPYVSDPVFQDALENFQKGDWNEGLDKLDTLAEQHPAITQLRDFRQDMALRSRVDEYERRETWVAILKKIGYWGVRIAALVIVLAFFSWGVNSYSDSLQAQWDTVREASWDQMHCHRNLTWT